MKSGDMVIRNEWGWLALVLKSYHKKTPDGKITPYIDIIWDDGTFDSGATRYFKVLIPS